MDQIVQYKFYYDETAHSRKINYKTVVDDNYYDNFITAFIGWPEKKEKEIFEKYSAFETKYENRKDNNGELKSTTLRQNRFKFGFASLNKQNVQFVDDFLSVFDEEVHFYFALASKMEYIVLQLFKDYQNNLFMNADEMKYAVTKALVLYRPKEVIQCLCENPEQFVNALKIFLHERIEANRKEPLLKEQESRAFEVIIKYLDQTSVIPKQQWDYHMSFDGFKKYLIEERIQEYCLFLDKEGEKDKESNTLLAAKESGLNNVKEINSMQSYGLRMTDMIVGIISKLLKALCESLRYNTIEEGVERKTLDARWFQLNEGQLNLYKKLYKIICIWDVAWYKTYTGNYADDLGVFIALLRFMNEFKSPEQMKCKSGKEWSSDFNRFSCEQLMRTFEIKKHKLPIEPVMDDKNGFVFNQRGAKFYYDIKRQPLFQIQEGSKIVYVLSVGIDKKNSPSMTIMKNNIPTCYRLPLSLSDWAYAVVALADSGENLFPTYVRFSNVNERYYADLL